MFVCVDRELNNESHPTQLSRKMHLCIQSITLDDMIHHCKAVKRGAPSRPLLVGDLPLGTYEFDNSDEALKNSYRMVKEGGMDAIKLEVSMRYFQGQEDEMPEAY